MHGLTKPPSSTTSFPIGMTFSTVVNLHHFQLDYKTSNTRILRTTSLRHPSWTDVPRRSGLGIIVHAHLFCDGTMHAGAQDPLNCCTDFAVTTRTLCVPRIFAISNAYRTLEEEEPVAETFAPLPQDAVRGRHASCLHR